jgi:ribosomal protein L16 Arg81 hydroxylase
VNYHAKSSPTQSPPEENPAYVAAAVEKLDSALRLRVESVRSEEDVDAWYGAKIRAKRLLAQLPINDIPAAAETMLKRLEAGEGFLR